MFGAALEIRQSVDALPASGQCVEGLIVGVIDTARRQTSEAGCFDLRLR
jgi:hypothetical protein